MKIHSNIRNRRSGFTLIELLIVVGIIAVLVVVLAVAILPWIAKSDVNATKSLLQQVGPVITGDTKVRPTLKKFREDAGDLSGRIHANEDIASSQMILFYIAPSRSVWDQSELYGGTNYKPKVSPDDVAEFTREEGGKLPYLIDPWGNPIQYVYDKKMKSAFVYSNGADGQWKTPDDIIYMASSNEVKLREEME
jgi:prepilin-type N-terminal cleavage/methylation domain-containing protein